LTLKLIAFSEGFFAQNLFLAHAYGPTKRTDRVGRDLAKHPTTALPIRIATFVLSFASTLDTIRSHGKDGKEHYKEFVEIHVYSYYGCF